VLGNGLGTAKTYNGQVIQLVVVPEPAAIGLALLGMALAALARRK
jgi:hypothetical protein